MLAIDVSLGVAPANFEYWFSIQTDLTVSDHAGSMIRKPSNNNIIVVYSDKELTNAAVGVLEF